MNMQEVLKKAKTGRIFYVQGMVWWKFPFMTKMVTK